MLTLPTLDLFETGPDMQAVLDLRAVTRVSDGASPGLTSRKEGETHVQG